MSISEKMEIVCRPLPQSEEVHRIHRHLDDLNRRIGLTERLRGLHYWLGYEYALAILQLDLRPGQRVLDVGTGAYSTFPYLLASMFGVDVVAIDIDETFFRQRQIRDRASRSGICEAEQVRLVRGDARQLPFPDESFDAFTAMSSLEHVKGRTGDRKGLQEASRVLRADGAGIVSVPFRAQGSMVELGPQQRLYQRHFSEETLRNSFIGPSGLTELVRTYYGERRPAYSMFRRMPNWALWVVRPWNGALSRRFMSLRPGPEEARAVMVKLTRSDLTRLPNRLRQARTSSYETA